MTREIHDIPPSPRAVLWRAVLWHWWPVAFCGFILGVYGGLWTLMWVLAMGGKQADDLLIEVRREVVTGTVTRIEGGPDNEGSRPMRLSYVYTTESGDQRSGRGFLDLPGVGIGDPIPIEYSATQPHVSRPEGGRIAMVPPLDQVFFWLLLAPGMTCIATWLLAVLRLRRLMIHGDVAVAEVMTIDEIRYVLPTTLRVVYSFRDHSATQRMASHWVRGRSDLGMRLTSNPKQIAVIHSRDGRGASRLVMATDFRVQPIPQPDHPGRPHPDLTPPPR